MTPKVSLVMSHPLATDSPSIGKKISTINAPKLSTISQNPRPGLRHSISMPENEKLFTEAAALSAAPSGEILLTLIGLCYESKKNVHL